MSEVTNPKVSVVIPAYCPGEMVLATMDSLVNQTWKDFEVIFSDDGSKDNTLELVRPYLDKLDFKIIENENFGGPGRPRNKGIEIARGEWIAFLDHDDLWYPEKMEEVSVFLDDYDVIYHDLEIINNDMEVTGKIKTRPPAADFFSDLVVNGNAIANSGAMARKELIEKVGCVDEDKTLIAAEDFDLWIKISRETSRFKYIEKILGKYRLEPGQNLTQATMKMIKAHQAIYDRYEQYLSDQNRKYALANVSYTSGRIYYKLGMYKESFQSYLKALGSNKLHIKVRTLVGFVLLFFKKLVPGS